MTNYEATFGFAGTRVGVVHAFQATLFAANYGQAFLDAAKRHARLLEVRFPDVGHRKMLEAVAKAAGFPNWHAFQTVATRLIEDYQVPEYGSRQDAPESVLAPLIPALPLLIEVKRDLAPTETQRNGLEKIGERLAGEIGAPVQAVMDVLAHLQDADSWSKLNSRRPEQSLEPLYAFRLMEEGDGLFEWSVACAALVDRLDQAWQGYSDWPKREQRKAEKIVLEMVTSRPDFLEGQLALATMNEENSRENAALAVFEKAIERAEDLIPEGFKGKISWGYTENRFYHRLLFNYMRLCVKMGQLPKAIKMARRQLRLNPNDNLGVRFDLPVYLAASGKHDSAAVALRAFNKKDAQKGAQEFMVMSLCRLAAGSIQDGAELFLRALFDLPMLRPILLDNKVPDYHSDGDWEWHRGVIPDIESMWFEILAMTLPSPELTVLYTQILRTQEVTDAEKRMAATFSAEMEKIRHNWSMPDTTYLWRNDCARTSKALAQKYITSGEWAI